MPASTGFRGRRQRMRFIHLNNAYEVALDSVSLDAADLRRARLAMIGAVGVGRGQIRRDRSAFDVWRREVGSVRPDQGGVFEICGPDGDLLVRVALCADANAAPSLWRAAHDVDEVITSRPSNPMPALPWAASVTGIAVILSWGRTGSVPFPATAEHLAAAWRQIHAAGGLG